MSYVLLKKTDGTLDQPRPLFRLRPSIGTVYSIDLKSATDRWPLRLILMFHIMEPAIALTSLFDSRASLLFSLSAIRYVYPGIVVWKPRSVYVYFWKKINLIKLLKTLTIQSKFGTSVHQETLREVHCFRTLPRMRVDIVVLAPPGVAFFNRPTVLGGVSCQLRLPLVFRLGTTKGPPLGV